MIKSNAVIEPAIREQHPLQYIKPCPHNTFANHSDSRMVYDPSLVCAHPGETGMVFPVFSDNWVVVALPGASASLLQSASVNAHLC